MTVRNRSRTWKVGASGSATWRTSERYYNPSLATETCTDVVGHPHRMNPLDIHATYWERFTPINGERTYLGYEEKQVNAVPSCVYIGSHASAETVPGHYEDYTSAIAAAHPGEPKVDLPVFLYELKDVPYMLKHAKERALNYWRNLGEPPTLRQVKHITFTKNRGEDWLNYYFGWRPFFSDLADIARIASELPERHQRFSRWAQQKYISRRSRLGENTRREVNNRYPFDSFLYNWYASAEDTFTTEKWCVSHWKTDPYHFDSILQGVTKGRLIRQYLGLDVNIAHIWDAMPWTWLSDWFVNIGDMIHIHANRFGIHFDEACVMEHNRAERVITPRPRSGFTTGQAVIVDERKSRLVVGPSLLPSGFNYLNPNQLVTLASLKVTRARQWHRL